MSNKLEIYTYLDMSTVHITKKDNELLEAVNMSNLNVGGPITYAYDRGYFIFVGEEIDDDITYLKETGYSEDFINLLLLAMENSCVFLRLDCDGAIYDHLPKHEWG